MGPEGVRQADAFVVVGLRPNRLMHALKAEALPSGSDYGRGFGSRFRQHIAVLSAQPRSQGFTLSLTDAATAFAADELLTGVGELKVRIIQGSPVGQPALSAAGVDLIPPGMASNVGRAGRTYQPRPYRFGEQRLEPRQGPFEAPA